MKKDDFFNDYCPKNLTFWQCFLLSLWSHCVFAHKLCAILQTLTTLWLIKFMKKFRNPPPITLEF